MARLNSAGAAVYGVNAGTIAVDGTVPAALATYIGGLWGWFDDTHILGAAQIGVSGVVELYDYDTVGHGITVADAGSANRTAAGGGVWAAWSAGSGVRTNVGAIPSLPNAFLGDVSPTGQVAVVNSYANAQGITVYDSAGAILLSLPTVGLGSGTMRLRDNYLAYYSTSGWQIVNVVTGLIPSWYPQTTPPSALVPVLVDGILWVVESGTTVSARVADSGKAYVVETSARFWPDALNLSAGVLRMAYSTTVPEAPGDLVETDLTVATGATQRGVVSGGVIVRSAGPTVTPTNVTLGPLAGTDLTNFVYPPLSHPVTDPNTGDRMTDQWMGWVRQVRQNINVVSLAIQRAPVPQPAVPSFETVAATGAVPVVAFTPGSTLTVTSADGSVKFLSTPSLQTLDLSVQSVGSGRVGPPGPAGNDGDDGMVIPGPQGPTGPTGATGPTGPTGPAGPTGIGTIGQLGPPGIDGDDGEPGIQGPVGPIGPQGPTGPSGPSGIGTMGSQGPPGTDGEDGESILVLQPSAAAGAGGAAAGANGDVQINVSGVLGVDTGVFTYTTGTHTLNANNVTANSATALALTGGVSGGGAGGAVTVTGGATSTTSTSGGSVTIAGGSPTAGSSTTAGSVTIKSGDALFTSGSVTITTGTVPASSAALSASAIDIEPSTPTSAGAANGVTGQGTAVKGGPGQANSNNRTAGNGGVLALAGGVGGINSTTASATNTSGTGGAVSVTGGAGANATGSSAGGTYVGGSGGAVTVAGGAGGSATGAAGTRNGKDGGNVVLTPGAAGTGATANGKPGVIQVGGIVQATGSQPTLSGSSTSSQTGGTCAGSFVSGVTGVSTVTMTFAVAMPTGWAVQLSNLTTTANVYVQTGTTTTTATVSGTTNTSDVINFIAIGY